MSFYDLHKEESQKLLSMFVRIQYENTFLLKRPPSL